MKLEGSKSVRSQSCLPNEGRVIIDCEELAEGNMFLR